MAGGAGVPHASRKRQYSASRSPHGSESPSSSGSSGSDSDGARDGGPVPKRRPAPAAAAGGRGEARQALVGSSGALSAELQARIQQLEATLAQERAGREADRAKLTFVSEKVRSVAERSRNRGSTLVKLLAAVRHADRARAAVEDAKAKQLQAEADLSAVVQQATSMMEGEDMAYGGQQQQPAAALPPVKEETAAEGVAGSGAAGEAAPPVAGLSDANGSSHPQLEAAAVSLPRAAGGAQQYASYGTAPAVAQQQAAGGTQAARDGAAMAGGSNSGRSMTGFKFKLNVA